MSVTVSAFIDDCKKDLSGQRHIYPRHMAMYKNMVFAVDELLEADKVSTHKLKKSMKGLQNAHSVNVQNEIAYAESMEKLGSVALSREAETGIGTAFLKLSVITKELANHRKIMYENFNNLVLFPINSLLKGDMNKIGDMKRPVDDAWKEYKSKGIKKEGRKKTTEIILYRIDPPQETSEDSERERRMFMYHVSEYLSKANDVKTKKGVELVQHLIEHYYAQLKYFNSGIELLEGMRSYFDGLAEELQQLLIKSIIKFMKSDVTNHKKLEKEEEKKDLSDIRNQLKTMLQIDAKEEKSRQNYKIHGQQGDKVYGGTKAGILQKRSEGVRKQWQKRYCVIRNGMFTLAHNQQSAPTVTLQLMTCQVRPSTEKDKKLQFALVAHNRTYLFSAEDEADFEAWISVLSNAREDALNKAFGEGDGALTKEPVSSIQELTQGIISEVRRLPGNNQCVDCNAYDPTWLSTNLGVLVCIECSGIHRELGVHISRIRSLTLDRLGTAELLLARAVGNSGFNEIMEAALDPTLKPKASSKMEQRKEFIQQKYVQKAFINPGHQPDFLLEDLQRAINLHDILAVLQLYADGVDFTLAMPDNPNNNTALHYCIEKEDLTSLHIVDFITQNCKNVNVINIVGNTALHISVINNSPECAKLLVRNGANLDAVNRDGKTPLKIAQENNYKEIIELLQDDGKSGKFDHVKIDWGLHETEDIYATPLDIIEQIKNSEEQSNGKKTSSTANQPSVHSSASFSASGHTSNIVKRSMTSPKVKTNAIPTPAAPMTSAPSPPSRHSVALPHNYQVEKQQPPPPPPSRRSTIKPKVPVPSVTQSSKAPASNTSPTDTTSNNATSDAMVQLTSTNAPTLSTFVPKVAPKPTANQNAPPPEKGGGVVGPPVPPTRSSSFLPRNSIDEHLLPRPDRPPPPVPHGHTRNKSDVGLFFSQDLGNLNSNNRGPNNTNNNKGLDRNRANSVSDYYSPNNSLNTSSGTDNSIPIDPDAPPLPPPRPKNKEQKEEQSPQNPVNTTGTPNAANSANSGIPRRTSSISRRQQEQKVKVRRAKALYDCEADHSDELTFTEGEIIIMKGEADPDWWYGEIEGEPQRKGVFPISFVHVLNG